MSEGSVGVDTSESSSVNRPALQEDSVTDDDKPNITVDGQKEVHLKVRRGGDEDEGSIVAARQGDYPIDPSKDPKISHVRDNKDAGKAQSKCCLLI